MSLSHYSHEKQARDAYMKSQYADAYKSNSLCCLQTSAQATQSPKVLPLREFRIQCLPTRDNTLPQSSILIFL